MPTVPPIPSGYVAPTSEQLKGVSAADMGFNPGGAGGGLNSMLYAPPPQPQLTPRGGQPEYFLSSGQYIPYPVSNPASAHWNARNQTQIEKQLVPTSVNVRNASLAQMLQQLATPMQSTYLAGNMDQAAQGYGAEGGSLASAMASRGMTGSGGAESLNRTNLMSYLQNLSQGQLGAQQQGDARTNALLNQLMGVANSDMSFYQGIRSGNAGQSPIPPNYGFAQLSSGIQSIIKTVASMGVGGLAGGAAGAGGGSGLPAGLGSGAMGGAGEYGISYGGAGGAGGEYGMSSAGGLGAFGGY